MFSDAVTRISMAIGVLALSAIAAALDGTDVEPAATDVVPAVEQESEPAVAEPTYDQSHLLEAALKAVAAGQCELAIQNYLLSLNAEPGTSEKAIEGVVDVLVTCADEARSSGKYVEESLQLNRCVRLLESLQQRDAMLGLDVAARGRLYGEQVRVKQLCVAAAASRIEAARSLRHQAKGTHWWINDDESLQKQALHNVYLAWTYREHLDEGTIDAVYGIWADMKDELGTGDYNFVTESDRLKLGQVIGG